MIKKVVICGVNTSKLPMLSNEEKQELLIKIKNGDTEAREKVYTREFKVGFICCTKIWRKRRKSR